jgi:hypothetical protein
MNLYIFEYSNRKTTYFDHHDMVSIVVVVVVVVVVHRFDIHRSVDTMVVVVGLVT